MERKSSRLQQLYVSLSWCIIGGALIHDWFWRLSSRQNCLSDLSQNLKVLRGGLTRIILYSSKDALRIYQLQVFLGLCWGAPDAVGSGCSSRNDLSSWVFLAIKGSSRYGGAMLYPEYYPDLSKDHFLTIWYHVQHESCSDFWVLREHYLLLNLRALCQTANMYICIRLRMVESCSIIVVGDSAFDI